MLRLNEEHWKKILKADQEEIPEDAILKFLEDTSEEGVIIHELSQHNEG